MRQANELARRWPCSTRAAVRQGAKEGASEIDAMSRKKRSIRSYLGQTTRETGRRPSWRPCDAVAQAIPPPRPRRARSRGRPAVTDKTAKRHGAA
eukprot:10460429-Alexandrium_andersonii.AAC.1